MSDASTESTTGTRNSGEKVRNELERLLETVWSSSERALDALGLGGLTGKELLPRIDVLETASTVEVLADIPGINPEDVNISLIGNMLTIDGALPLRTHRDGESVQRRERPTGKFSRSIPLPATVDPESVTAAARNGVLEITLTKPESEKPRQIKIQVKSRSASEETASSPEA